MAHIILGVSDDPDSSIFKIPQIPILINKAPYSSACLQKLYSEGVRDHALQHYMMKDNATQQLQLSRVRCK